MKLIKKYTKQDNHYPMPDAEIRFVKPWFKLGAYSYNDYTCDGEEIGEAFVPDTTTVLVPVGQTMRLGMVDDIYYTKFIHWLNQMIKDGYIEILNPEIFEWKEAQDE